MDKKATDIVCYLTWVGWIIAFVAGDREGSKFHLNQSLVIGLAGIICTIAGRFPFVGWVAGIVGFVVAVFNIIGFIYACTGQEKELPVVGGIKILY